jgi:hypothetical protein
VFEALVTNLECHNFSTSFVCTSSHTTLLANGVKFAPTPFTLPVHALEREVKKFVNSSRWRAFHASHGDNNDAVNPPERMPALYRPSGLIAEPGDEPVERWLSSFSDQVMHLGATRLCVKNADIPRNSTDPHLRHFNLPALQRRALAELIAAARFTRHADGSFSPPRIVICNADKNLGLTIVDYEWFRKECTAQLNNLQFYRKIEPRLAPQLIWAAYLHLKRLVFAGRRVRNFADAVPEPAPDKRSAAQRFLLAVPPDHPSHRTPSFYVIPKVHKPRLVGRPITPAHRFCLAPACELITRVLHPIVSLVPEILRDTTQLLLELEESATLSIVTGEEIYLITGDVESLYTNIPRLLCLELLASLPIPRVILDLLALVFESCYVRFDNEYFQQIDGFPMGISPAPDVANLFLWLLVRQLGTPPPSRLLYRRLIDDLFIVWRGPRAALDAYLATINSLHRNIRITWTISRQSAAFLDLDIHLGERYRDGQRRLDVRVHQKQLNRYLYIPSLSFHKRSQHRAWIKAELLRFVRNTSSPTDYKRLRRAFFKRLCSRGHRIAFLRSVFSNKWSAHSNRDTLLSLQQHRQDTAYKSAVQLVDQIASPSSRTLLLQLWTAWCTRDSPASARTPATPWPDVEGLLLRQDLVSIARDRSLDDLFGLYTREAPPPAFFIPLTSATAGLRWRNLALTQPPKPITGVSDHGNKKRKILLVHRRPPTLGMLLRFRNPLHCKPLGPRNFADSAANSAPRANT